MGENYARYIIRTEPGERDRHFGTVEPAVAIHVGGPQPLDHTLAHLLATAQLGELSQGHQAVAVRVHELEVLVKARGSDARFVAANYTLDWTRSLGKPFSLVLASAGQVASRPLLATMEFGLGGPMFGRGYDYAERTGEQQGAAPARRSS